MRIIEVKNLSRSFIIPHARRDTPWQRLESVFRGKAHSADEILYALREVSFDVEKGEVVGIIGRNGSGKSTLLKIVANIIRPTSGRVKVTGKISPLLELGMGFHKELTSVENIYLYGGYLGISRASMVDKVDRIMEFAELERFRDARLKNFSSGMRSRLAFSVAIQVEPDILLLDEVFAVGDFLFKQKCLREMERFKEAGTTILFVSHDMGAVERYCDRTIVLDQGYLVFDGESGQAVESYIHRMGEEQSKKKSAAKIAGSEGVEAAADIRKRKMPEPEGGRSVPAQCPGDDRVRLERVQFLDKQVKESETFRSGDSIRVRIHYKARKSVRDPVFGISIYDSKRTRVYGTNTKNLNKRIEAIQGIGCVDFAIPSFPLAEGQYLVTVALHDWTDPRVVHDWIEKGFSFQVVNPEAFTGHVNLRAQFEMRANVQGIREEA